MPREICMFSEKVGRDTPCWWDCGDVCKRKRFKPKYAGYVMPSNLPSLVAWYRYGLGITSAAGLVSQWDDQSGNGNHLVQASGTNQPALQSDNSILFDGTDNFLKASAFTLVQPETIYFLGRNVTHTASDRMFDGETSNSGAAALAATPPNIVLNAGSTAATNTLFTTNVYAAVACVFNGASSRIQVNSTQVTTGDPGAGNMGGFTLGARGAGDLQYANIQVKEVMVYSVAHSQDTRNNLINYLLNVVNG